MLGAIIVRKHCCSWRYRWERALLDSIRDSFIERWWSSNSAVDVQRRLGWPVCVG